MHWKIPPSQSIIHYYYYSYTTYDNVSQQLLAMGKWHQLVAGQVAYSPRGLLKRRKGTDRHATGRTAQAYRLPARLLIYKFLSGGRSDMHILTQTGHRFQLNQATDFRSFPSEPAVRGTVSKRSSTTALTRPEDREPATADPSWAEYSARDGGSSRLSQFPLP